MLKRIILSLLVALLIAVPVIAAGPEIEFDVGNLYPNSKEYVPLAAYTLSNNSSYGGTGEGIQAGWTYDGRGDFLRYDIESGSYYGNIVDISTENGTSLYRDLNKVDEGKVYLETAVSFKVGFDGLELFLTDEAGEKAYSLKTDDEALWILDGESYTKFYLPEELKTFNVKVYIDFTADTPVAKTVIDDEAVVSTALLSDNIMRFGFATSDADVLTVIPSSVKITANYLVDNEFKFTSSKSKALPYGWSTSDIVDAYVLNGEAFVMNGASLSKAFISAVDKGVVATEIYLFAHPGSTGKVALTSISGDKVAFSFDGTNFKLNDTVVYENYLENLWYRLRFETDIDNSKAKVYVNGRVVAEDIAIDEIEYVNAVKVSANGDGIIFDNILIHSLVKADDYVPEPVLPTADDNIVGINVCSLWSYESNHGWLSVTPYDDFKPILGYYDEGSPEVADWEIKMMVEHGIDFQAFCWYANNWKFGSGDDAVDAIKYPAHSLQLHEGYMYAEYSDLMKYCLIWEASNGGVPSSVEQFKNSYVPYWIENYFKDPRYLVIDNQPVLMSFGYTRFIDSVGGEEAAAECMDYLRAELQALGFKDLIVIANHTQATEKLVNSGANGVAAYNWGTDGKDVDYSIGRIQSSANQSAKVDGMWTIPTLSTGFNSLPWHGKRYGNMTPADFTKGLTYMRDEYFTAYQPTEAWQNKLYMLSTWNEYGEGTYIMPSEGLYGFGYLEAVRSVLTNADNTSHVDYIPTASQLSRITKNYPQHIRALRRNDTYVPDSEKSLAAFSETVFEGHEFFKVGACESVSYDNGVSGRATGATSYVETADVLGIEITDAAALNIKMTVNTATTVKVWYTTEESQYYVQDQVLTFDAVPGADSYTIDFPVKNVTLRSLRIMPTVGTAVNFSIKKVSVLSTKRLYIDEKCIESSVYPETIGDNVYYPFDPGLAQGYIMNCHFTWDAAAKVLTIYAANGKWIEYTVGSAVAKSSEGNVTLPKAVYLSDNLPMLHMETLCDVLGFEYEYKAKGLHIKTAKYAQNSAFFTAPENEWSFTSGSNLGWTGDNVEFNIADDNTLHIKAYEGDPRAYSPVINLVADKYKAIEVEIKYNSENQENLSLFFTTKKDTNWDEAKHLMKKLPSASSGDEFVTVTFDLNDVNTYAPISWNSPENVKLTWEGTVTKFRLDAGDREGFECWIKSIKLIPDETFDEESTDVVKTDFTSVTFDAEDGEMPFSGGNIANITIVDDPANSGNKVYKVTPKSGYEKSQYLSLYYGMNFEPGATYTVSFKFMTETSGKKIASDFIFVDPAKEGSANANNHFSSSSLGMMDGTSWTTHTASVTVGNNCFDRTKDEFRIYTDPAYFTSNTVSFYVDDIVITKTTSTNISGVSASKSGSNVTVTGNSGIVLPGEKSVVVAVYEGNRLLGMKVVHLNESSEFTCNFADAAGATNAKVFMWKGLRTFAPESSVVEVNVQ